jgi:hypothetical protein
MLQINRVDTKLLLWAAEFSLAICLVYTLFYLASSLGLQYFILSNRAMVERTVSGPVLSSPLDIAVWGIAIFVVLTWLGINIKIRNIKGLGLFVILSILAIWVCLVFFGFFSVLSLVLISSFLLSFCLVFTLDIFGIHRSALFLRLLFGGLLIVLFFEIASFVLFTVPTALGLDAEALGSHWSKVEVSFSSLPNPFLPYIYLLFIVCGVGAFIFRVLPGRWSQLLAKVRAENITGNLAGFFRDADDGFGFMRDRFVVLAVVGSSIISCLFVLLTVLPWNNPTGMLVSVDSPVYYNWINHMRGIDVNSALSFALGNDRALLLVLGYTLSFFTSTLNVVQFLAAFLIVQLGVVSLLVLRLFCKNRLVWVLGVLLVPFSFQSLGLIYSGYFANMMALILIFVYVLLFFRVLGSWSILGFFSMLSASVLVLFSHSWTWFVFALSLCLFLFMQWRLSTHDRGLYIQFRKQAILVVATICVGLLCDLMRKLLSPASSTASVVATAQSSIGLPNPSYLLSGLGHAVNITLGGVFSGGLLFFVSFLGFFVLLKFRSNVSNFFVSWICVSCVSILFAANSFVFDRFLFILPWVILSGLGLYSVILLISSKVEGKSRRLMVLGVFFAFVFLLFLNESMRYISNINIW